MSLNVTFNGSVYIVPETGEVGWGGNTTSYLVAIAAGALQKTGGSFTLSAETDFGASFGLKSLYYKSRSANIAAAGIVRLNNNSDSISWRNAANNADLALFPNASNLLTFNGNTIYTIGAGTITNADIAAGAGIVYSKLNLTNSIVNADVNTSAAISYSKLNLSLSIVNADVSASAAIAYSKLNLSNSIVNADINTAAAIAYSKLTLTNSIVNADINASAAIAYSKLNLSASIVNADVSPSAAIVYSKLSLSNSILNADINASAAIAYSKLNLSNSILNADVNASAAIDFSKMAALTASRLPYINASGIITASGWASDGSTVTTSAVGELRFQDSTGGEYVGLVAPTAATSHSYSLPVAPGTAGQVLSWQTGGQLTWINAAGGGTINSGTAGFFSYYPATGTTLDDQPVLSTDGTNISMATGQLILPSGSNVSPSYTFTGDLDTGMYRAGANSLGFASAGTQGLRIDAGNMVISRDFLPNADASYQIGTGTNGFTRIFMNDGTSSAPSYTFSNQTTMGFRRVSANKIAYSAGTVDMVTIDTSTLDLTNNASLSMSSGNAAGPILAHRSNTDSGIYWPTTTSMAWSFDTNPFVTIRGDNSVDKGIYINNGYLKFGTAAGGGGDGTASAPILTWENDPDLGLYRSGTNELSITTNGVQRLKFESDGDVVITNSGLLKIADGSTGNPGLNFDADPNTGLFRSGTDQLSIATGGTEPARFNITGSGDGTTYTPLLMFAGNQFGGGGATNSSSFQVRTTASVSTTATTIGGTEYGIAVISGATAGGANIFTDLVILHYSQNATVVASKNSNSPAARTYSLSGDQLQLAMASGTYNISYMLWKTPLR